MENINPKVMELSNTNNLVRHAMSAHKLGHLSYLEALEQVVIALADANDTLTSELTYGIQNRKPSIPMMFEMGKGDVDIMLASTREDKTAD